MIRLSEEERTAQEWARAQGVELHGMTDERWAAYLRYLEDENRDKLAEVFKRLVDEERYREALRAYCRAGRDEALRIRRGAA
jgi:hypothetical protein